MKWWHRNWLAMAIIAVVIFLAWYTFQMLAIFGLDLLQWMGVL